MESEFYCNKDFVKDFVEPMKAELSERFFNKNEDYYRSVWAYNINDWLEHYTKNKLLKGLQLLCSYGNTYNADWFNSWVDECGFEFENKLPF